jgi:hypothetical protein
VADDFYPVIDASESDISSVPDFFQESYHTYLEDGFQPDADTGIIYLEDYSVELTPDGGVFGDYDHLRDYLVDTDLTGGTPSDSYVAEAHHLLSTSFTDAFGLDSDSAPAVALDRFDEDNPGDSHQFYTDAVAATLDSANFYDIDEVYQAHAALYEQSGHFDWAERALDYIADHRDELIGLYERGEIPGSNLPDYDDRVDRVTDWLRSIDR